MEECQNILEIRNLKKSYMINKENSLQVLKGLNISIGSGEMVALMGASGCGKTTLINSICGIDKADSGSIMIDHEEITKMRRSKMAVFRRNNIGLIFQDFNLLDTLTGYENIALALSIQNVGAREIEKRIMEIADTLNIKDVLKKYTYQMSGGQKQRVASARALITNPELILADEPTGALDSKSARELLVTMEKMNKEMNATILMVTHDAFTASYSKRVIFIKDGHIFNEIRRGSDNRKQFFEKIIDVVTMLGGDLNDAL